MTLDNGDVDRVRALGWQLSRDKALRPDPVPDGLKVQIEFACNALVSAEACR